MKIKQGLSIGLANQSISDKIRGLGIKFVITSVVLNRNAGGFVNIEVRALRRAVFDDIFVAVYFALIFLLLTF